MGISRHDIQKVMEKYPSWEHKECDGEDIFCGELLLNHIYNDVRMTGKFNVEIVVPRDYPLALPIVNELSNCIAEGYPHRYEGGQLCLASNLELMMFFNRNNDISIFVEQYIIPYLYTYKYYEFFGIYPYGERSHGPMGDLEYLKDLLAVNDWSQVYNIMIFVMNSHYRGHIQCPCGSGKRIRNCHGEIVKQMMDAGLRKECIRILKEIYKAYRKA